MAFSLSAFESQITATTYSRSKTPGVSQESSLIFPGSSAERAGPRGSLLEYGRKLHRAEMQRLKMRHRSGMGGREVVLSRSRLMDQLVAWSYEKVLQQNQGKRQESLPGMSIVALGGYGRQELAPYSDVDLMFLKKGRQTSQENQQLQEMLCLLWDMGFQVGHSARTIKDAVHISQEDIISQISMLDARLITGDADLFAEFSKRMESAIRKNQGSFEQRLLASIRERHASQGGTAFIQEPNVKEAKGGLRDFHCVSWIAQALYPGQALPEVLAQAEVSQVEWKKALFAYEFLQRLRNELHFLAGRRTDILSHTVLNTVAKNFGFRGGKFQKDSEAFLQYYYLQARRISQILETILIRRRSGSSRNFTWLGGKYLPFGKPQKKKAISHIKDSKLLQSPEKWMQHFRYGQSQAISLDEPARTAIRQSLPQFKQAAFSSSVLAADFRAILRNKGKVAHVIRQMHDLGFLGRVLPEFGRLTCLVQHDHYHKYTTDEHTLRALEILDQIAQGQGASHTEYQRILNEIHDSSTLYFALLMHDTGKGLGGGHSAKGALLVSKASSRLGFDPDEVEKIQLLVQHHLLMGHVSQRRHLDDSHTIEEFVKKVERPDILNMLLLITYADAQAVAPGVWTDWKDYLLWELYYKAYDRLMFAKGISSSARAELETVHQQVADLLKLEIDLATVRKHFRLMPEKYALYTSGSQIVKHLRLLHKLEQAPVVLNWEDHPDKGYTDLTLVTGDHPGLFAKIAGTLSAFNLNILSAQLNTRDDGVVFDQFQVGDQAGNYRLHQQDYPRVEKLLERVISGQISIEDYLRRHSRPHAMTRTQRISFPPRVRIDNEISPASTVIEVQADDRMGLGYQIAKTLADLKLNITFAKLATEKAHAFDVFYVQDQKGGKILDSARMAEIVEQLRVEVMGLSEGI